MKTDKQKPKSGFTLIEVMAALAIVSLGMLAVIEAVIQTSSNTAYIREKSIAHWVALNRITELRLAARAPAIGESNGEVEMGGVRWRWSANISQTQVASMKRLDVGVERADDDEHSQLAFVTGFYGEKIAQPGAVIAQFDAPVVLSPKSGTNPPPGAPASPPITPPKGQPIDGEGAR